MKYIEPIRIKVIMLMFYATGSIGMVAGLTIAPPSSTLIITFLGVINLALGSLFTYLLLTQQKKAPDKRKKKKKDR